MTVATGRDYADPNITEEATVMKAPKPELDFDVATPIVEKFGGRQRMSEITGHPYTRIDGWIRSRHIPERYRAGVLAAAKRHGIPHTPWDYISHLVELAALAA